MPLEPRITTLENLGDVSATVPTNNQVMAYNTSTRKFGPVTPPTVGEVAPGSDGVTHLQVARFTYDFSVSGGAVGSIPLDAVVPNGAVVTDGKVQVITPLASATGTAALQIQAANDVIAAAAVSGAPWSTAGVKDIVPAGTAATSIATTAARTVTLVVGTAALTAGKIVGWLRFYV